MKTSRRGFLKTLMALPPATILAIKAKSQEIEDPEIIIPETEDYINYPDITDDVISIQYEYTSGSSTMSTMLYTWRLYDNRRDII